MIFEKLPGESVEQFCLRLANEKLEDKSITWQDIADSLPENFNIFKSEAWVRRLVKQANFTTQNIIEDESIIDTLDEKILELKKERIKLADERSQNNAYIRRMAREDTIIEIAKMYADKMSTKPLLSNKKEIITKIKEKEAILCLSDWHYGIVCDNYWNKYDPDIAKYRISKLLNKTIEYIDLHNIDTLYVLNLGDLIAGRIHLTIRLESRFDVITQIMEVSEILAEFISKLSNHVNIEYYSCVDNHSRLEPNKSDSLELETLARITDWYLEERLSNIKNISINKNKYGNDIITFDTVRFKCLGVHGDHDKNNSSTIDSISRMTEDHYDLILTAHLHHFSADEKNRTVIISNSSLMGVDAYAKNLRLSSFPSQNLIIIGDNTPCEAIYRIKLD